MGGRGKSLEKEYYQIKLDEYEGHLKIRKIINESDEIRSKGNNGIGGNGVIPLKKCACCEEYTLPVNEQYAICSICGWIDDLMQNKNPDSEEGMNEICLNKARYNWKNYRKIMIDD